MRVVMILATATQHIVFDKAFISGRCNGGGALQMRQATNH